MIAAVDWSIVANALGVVAFVLVTSRLLIQRGRWFLRNALVLSRLDVVDGHLECWFLLSNPGPDFDCIFHFSLEVINPKPGAGLQRPWSRAVFVPYYSGDALTLVPPGALIKRVRTTLAVLDEQIMQPGGIDNEGFPVVSKSWQELETDVAGQLLLINCQLKVEMDTTYGKIILLGRSGTGQPIAQEEFRLSTRMRRVLGLTQ